MGLLSLIGSAVGSYVGGPVGGTIGGTIGSAIEGSDSKSASNRAADAQVAATNKAVDLQQKTANEQLALQKKMYTEGVARQEPWYAAGKTALSTLQAGLRPGGAFTKTFTPSALYTDPSYQWRLQQGQRALEQSQAAKGIQFTGGTQAALQDYAQNQASNEYANAYNRFMNDQNTAYGRQSSLAGVGQNVGTNIASSGQNMANASGVIASNMANAISGLYQDVGKAQSAGQIASSNAQQDQLGMFGKLLGNFNMPSGTPSSNPYGWGGQFNQGSSVMLSDGGTFSV